MSTYTLRGYALSDFYSSTGSATVAPGDVIQLAPTWDAATDYLQVNVTDDEGLFHGDANFDEVGSDSNQLGTIKDSSGNTLVSGRIYLEDRITLSDGEGNIVYVYVVEIGGGEQAILTNPPIVPGVTYSVSAVDNVDTSLGTVPNYSDFSWSPYDAATGQTYEGGAFSDQIEAGGGNDTVYSGGGADTVYGGDGNDTIYYGTGGATQSDGDTVYGGKGDDLIDDVGGSEYVYDDTLYGGGGNDTLYGGGGHDEIYGGTGTTLSPVKRVMTSFMAAMASILFMVVKAMTSSTVAPGMTRSRAGLRRMCSFFRTAQVLMPLLILTWGMMI